jgi:predicted metalloprotease with PDZ domain
MVGVCLYFLSRAAPLAALFAGMTAGAKTPSMTLEPIAYTLRFPAYRNHYLEVEAVVPADGRPRIELMMAVWTPGSYMVREYARHVEGLSARLPDGTALEVEKSRKNRWRIDTQGAGKVIATYRVYCRDLSVRGNWVDESFAILNGAPTFLSLPGEGNRPHHVELELPAEWSESVSALPALPGGGRHAYRARDFDTLVDSPIFAGNPAIYEFEVDGKKHVLVNEGEGGVWDGPRSARDLEQIVREYRRMWGFLPYERYVFFNLIVEGRGGLEHLDSTVLMTSRWKSRVRKEYLDWLGLASHEYLHAWNVKRLRPSELDTLDYEREMLTRSLWVAEGITSYYTDLAVCRAGLCTQEEYLQNLSKIIEQLQATPGRLVHSLELSSFDAWIKFYRPDENSVNTTVSYYVKGAVVAFLLDVKIRQATGGARSLDDVLRLAYERYSGARGFRREEFRGTAEEVAGIDLGDWFAAALETTAELDYDEALEWFGLRFKEEEPEEARGMPPAGESEEGREAQLPELPKPQPAKKARKGWLGISLRTEGGRLVVSQLRRDTPAYEYGINVEDEILAIDEYRVRPEHWEKRLEQYRPGERASILVARREKLRRIEVVFGEEPLNRWKLDVLPQATPEQRRRLQDWLRAARDF